MDASARRNDVNEQTQIPRSSPGGETSAAEVNRISAVPADVTSAAAGPVWGQPLPGGSSATPAVANFGPNTSERLVVVRTPDSRLFWTMGSFTNTWETFSYKGWNEIPGNGRSPYAPAASLLGEHVYVAVVGSGGNGVWFQKINLNTWAWDPGWSVAPGGGNFIAAPTLATLYEKNLMVYAPTASGELKQATWRPDSGWVSTWWTTPGIRTHVAAAAAESGFALHVFARGDDRRIYTMSISAFHGTGWSEVPGGGRTDHAPAVGGTPNPQNTQRLVLAVRGTGDGIFYQAHKDGTWNPAWNLLPQPGGTPHAPAVGNYGDFPVMYVTGHDRAVYAQHLQYRAPDARFLEAAISPQPSGWRRIPLSLPTTPAPQPNPPQPTPPPPPPVEQRFVFCYSNRSEIPRTYHDTERWATNVNLANNALYNDLVAAGWKPWDISIMNGTCKQNGVVT